MYDSVQQIHLRSKTGGPWRVTVTSSVYRARSKTKKITKKLKQKIDERDDKPKYSLKVCECSFVG